MRCRGSFAVKTAAPLPISGVVGDQNTLRTMVGTELLQIHAALLHHYLGLDLLQAMGAEAIGQFNHQGSSISWTAAILAWLQASCHWGLRTWGQRPGSCGHSTALGVPMKQGIDNRRQTCQLNRTQGHDRQREPGFDELHGKTENAVRDQ